jgi:hypothetical protein
MYFRVHSLKARTVVTKVGSFIPKCHYLPSPLLSLYHNSIISNIDLEKDASHIRPDSTLVFGNFDVWAWVLALDNFALPS